MEENTKKRGRPKRKIDHERFHSLVNFFDSSASSSYGSTKIELKKFAEKIAFKANLNLVSRAQANDKIKHLERRLVSLQKGEKNYYNDTEEGLANAIKDVKNKIYEPSDEEYAELRKLINELPEEDWKRTLLAIRQRKRRKDSNKRTKQLSLSYRIFHELSKFKEEEQIESWEGAFDHLLEIYRYGVKKRWRPVVQKQPKKF